MALDPPYDFMVTVLSSSEVYMEWQNAEMYHYIQIWENRAGAGYVLVERISGHNQEHTRESLDAGISYCWEIKGETIEPPQESNASNEECKTMYGTLYVPSNVEVLAISGTQVEIIFKDNSTTEDDHRIEQKLMPAGGWSEVKTVPPNFEYAVVGSLASGSTYRFRIRAKEGVSYSGYSSEVEVTMPSVPTAPIGLAISELNVDRLRLSWTLDTSVAGYKIFKSTNGADYTEIARVIDINNYLVRDLAPSSQYWFKIKAYNLAGDSSYSSAVNDTTLAQYQETEFEKAIENPLMKPRYLAEITELKMDCDCFSLTSGKTNTYELSIQHGGICITAVYENDIAYTERSSITDVENNASSFYFDYWNRILYIHTSGSDSPWGYFIEAEFALYTTNKQDEIIEIVFNDNNYLPILKKESIPSVNQDIMALFEGNFAIDSGSIAFNNIEIDGEYFFDKIYRKFTWRGAKIQLKVGFDGFAYSNYFSIFKAVIEDVNPTDDYFTVELRDMRQSLNKPFPLNRYSVTDYPLIELNREDVFKPIQYGYIEDSVPVCIDRNNKKYHFHDGRVYSVSAVKVNGVAKTEDTHYYIDYQRAIITFAESFDIDYEEDIVTVSFFGKTDAVLDLLENGAEIFIDIMKNYGGLNNVDLNFDKIYEARDAIDGVNLSVPIFKEDQFELVVRTLEHSTETYSIQDNQGRIALRINETLPEERARVINNHQIFNFSQNKGRDTLFRYLNIYYKQNISTNEWEVVEHIINKLYWKYGTQSLLEIFTYLESSYYAGNLASAIADILDKDYVSFDVSMVLYDALVGDLIYLNRDRFYNTAGEAIDLLMRIVSLNKSASDLKTVLVCELVDLLDNFDKGYLHHIWSAHKTDADRLVTVANNVCTIATQNNADALWSSTKNEAPKIIMAIPGTPAEFITKLNSFTINDDTMAGIFIASDAQGIGVDKAIIFGRYRNDSSTQNGLRAFDLDASEDAYIAVTTLPMWLKVIVPEKTNSDIICLYSADGSSWTELLRVSNYYQTGHQIGLFARSWGVFNSISAPFEYFKMARK